MEEKKCQGICENCEPMTMGEWLVTILITCIPLIGIIMLFVWAFGSGVKPSKSNWAKANLIWMAISFVFCCMFFSTIIAALSGMSGY